MGEFFFAHRALRARGSPVRLDEVTKCGGRAGEDVAALKKMGVGEVLLQDAPPETIVGTVRRLVAERGPR